MMCLLGIINPGYLRVLFEDPKGPMILMLAAFNQLVGSAIIWKIIHIDI